MEPRCLLPDEQIRYLIRREFRFSIRWLALYHQSIPPPGVE